MSKLSTLGSPKVDALTVSLTAPNLIRISGRLTMRDPSQHLQGYLGSVHEAAIADKLKELIVDLSGLTFVNSSSIRLFVDWTMWVKDLDPARRYLLRFRTNRNITWQKACFAALAVLAGGVIVVEETSTPS